MLDSSACIRAMRARNGPLPESLIASGNGRPLVSTIVIAELERGVAASARRDHARARVDELLEACEICDFDWKAAMTFGPIRTQLARQGCEIGPMDFLIAAHALALQLPLLTANVRDFRCVPGLRVIPLDKA